MRDKSRALNLKKSEWFKLAGHRTGGRDAPLVAFSESEFYSVASGKAGLGKGNRGNTTPEEPRGDPVLGC